LQLALSIIASFRGYGRKTADRDGIAFFHRHDSQARNGGADSWPSWIILRVEMAILCVDNAWAGSFGQVQLRHAFRRSGSLGWNYGGELT
jgi:hypothetical protein